MKTFAILNMKGGVGKTTTAINLAFILATTYEKRVLLVDGDAQGNTTKLLLPPGKYDGLAALLGGLASFYDEVIQPTEIANLDVLPASEDLYAVDLKNITSDGARSFAALRDMRDALEEDDAYDVMIVDCPPGFTTACISAIQAADSIIIPVLPDAFSAEGMAELVYQIDSCRAHNPRVRVGGILINQWHNADVVSDAEVYLREEAPVPVYSVTIRRTDKVVESTWAKEPVLTWSPQSSASRDFRCFAEELVANEGL